MSYPKNNDDYIVMSELFDISFRGNIIKDFEVKVLWVSKWVNINTQSDHLVLLLTRKKITILVSRYSLWCLVYQPKLLLR